MLLTVLIFLTVDPQNYQLKLRTIINNKCCQFVGVTIVIIILIISWILYPIEIVKTLECYEIT